MLVLVPPFVGLRALAAGAALLAAAALPLHAQRSAAARDSAELARQARLIARLDSQLTQLRREVRAREADTTGAPAVERTAGAATPGGMHAGGLLQVWYAQGDGGFLSTFRVRRAEIKLTGDASSRARWTLAVDAARALTTTSATTDVGGTSVVTGTAVNQSSRLLLDAFFALALPGRLELDVGQFKLPLGLEGGVQSPAALETVERAMYTSDRARGGNYGDARDVGVMLRAPSGRDVDLSVGVFNGMGESQNDIDRNRQKAIVGRAVARLPFLRPLALGASGAWNTSSDADSALHQRAGVDARLALGGLLLKSEYMGGRDGQRRGAGWYGHVGYSPTTRLDLLARYDVFDPDVRAETSIADARERDWVAGFTYLVPVYSVRLQMNYLHKMLPPSIAPERNLLLANLQTSW